MPPTLDQTETTNPRIDLSTGAGHAPTVSIPLGALIAVLAGGIGAVGGTGWSASRIEAASADSVDRLEQRLSTLESQCSELRRSQDQLSEQVRVLRGTTDQIYMLLVAPPKR